MVSNCDHLDKLKFSKALPFAFNEHGALMAASVLNSSQAVELSVFVVRAFVRLRQTLAQNKELARKMAELEGRLIDHDQQIVRLITAIRRFANPIAVPRKRRIGFSN